MVEVPACRASAATDIARQHLQSNEAAMATTLQSPQQVSARTIVSRSVQRIDHPAAQQGMSPRHRVRVLMPAAMRGDWASVDPFLALMEDWFPAGVFGKHPHRGIETMTYVMEGRLNHADNKGGKGTLNPGDAQWMTAGHGIVHAEEPVDDDTVHGFQLWVNLPAAHKMVPPRYQDLRGNKVPVRREDGAEVRVFSGSSGSVTAPTQNYAPVTMLDLRLDKGAEVRLDLPADYNAFVVVISGMGFVGADRTTVVAGDIAWLTRGDDPTALSEVRIEAGAAPLHGLLIGGRPLGEPVVARGPFVMNSEAEIKQAYADYRAGRFGPE
jgi:redox-sensitive bicupin YhaK (pirin superfamily)